MNYIYFKLPDIVFIMLYEEAEIRSRDHPPNHDCSSCKMFNDMSDVAEIRYDHDEKTYSQKDL